MPKAYLLLQDMHQAIDDGKGGEYAKNDHLSEFFREASNKGGDPFTTNGTNLYVCYTGCVITADSAVNPTVRPSERFFTGLSEIQAKSCRRN